MKRTAIGLVWAALAAAVVYQQLEIAVLSGELYSVSNPLTVHGPKAANHLEDVIQATARLCELSQDATCAADLGMGTHK